MTLLDGSRYYLAVRDARESAPEVEVDAPSLLSISVDDLRRQIVSEADSKAQQRLAALDVARSQSPQKRRRSLPKVATALWVDKYAPAAFAHLLSDERTNRDVLRALKSWDPFVFRRKAPPAPALPVFSNPGSSTGGNSSGETAWKGKGGDSQWKSGGGGKWAAKKLNGSGGNYGRMGDDPLKRINMGSPGRVVGEDSAKRKSGGFSTLQDDTLRAASAADKRPHKRIILLAGDPGSGKTTLAHVLAVHAGYRVVEINASDDRTAGVLTQAVGSAASNRTIPGGNTPTCVILDELDGADGKQAIAAIIAMALAPLKTEKAAAKTAEEEGDSSDEDRVGDSTPKKKRRTSGAKKSAAVMPKKKKDSGGKKSVPPLTRPLICICNDAWAPHLRGLRDVAQVFSFRSAATTQRLVSRLRAVATSEKLNVSPAALGALAEASRGDVRACLHTLQFASSGSGASAHSASISAAVYSAVATGLKDQRTSDFELWRGIFSRGRGTKRRAPAAAAETVSASSLRRVVDSAGRAGDAGGLLSAVLENYVKVPTRDASMRTTACLLEDLSQADSLLGTAWSGGHFELLKYASATAAAAAHLRCRVDHPPKMQAPGPGAVLRKAAAEKSWATLRLLDDGRVPLPRQGRAASALDLAPALVRVINEPRFRAVNADLLRPAEKAALFNTVDILRSNGLDFERKEFEGVDEWKMRPDVEALSRYPLDAQPQTLGPFARAALHRELALVKVRRKGKLDDVAAAGGVKRNAWDAKPAAKDAPEVGRVTGFSFAAWGAKNDNERKRPVSKAAAAAAKAAAGADAPSSSGAAHVRAVVTFRFQKGYTNAVRRIVTVEDLLL